MKFKRILAGAMAMVMVAGSLLVSPVNAGAADAGTADTVTGLTGYYTFDDTLMNSVSGSYAKLHGGAGDTWNADATGTAAYATGKAGNAYSFTGDVDGARGEGLELDVTTGEEFTISLWACSDEKINYQPVLFTNIDGDNYVNYVTNINSFSSASIVNYKTYWNFLDCGTYMDDTKGTAAVGDLTVDSWIYITITLDANGVASLYHNGELVDVDTIVTNDGDDEDTELDVMTAGYFKNMPIFLGINWWDQSFKGEMDEVTVYDRALTAADVAALYADNGIPADYALGGQYNNDPMESGSAEITVGAGETYYFEYYTPSMGEYTINVTGETGFSLGAYLDPMYPMPTVVADTDGAAAQNVTTSMMAWSTRFFVQNTTNAAQTYNVSVVPATTEDEGGSGEGAQITDIGTYEAPLELTELGDYEVSLHAQDGMTFLTWTAAEAGTFTVTSSGSMGELQIYSLTDASGEETYIYNSTAQVAAGDVLLIKGEGAPGYVVPVTFAFTAGASDDDSTETGTGTFDDPYKLVLDEENSGTCANGWGTHFEYTATEAGTLTCTIVTDKSHELADVQYLSTNGEGIEGTSVELEAGETVIVYLTLSNSIYSGDIVVVPTFEAGAALGTQDNCDPLTGGTTEITVAPGGDYYFYHTVTEGAGEYTLKVEGDAGFTANVWDGMNWKYNTTSDENGTLETTVAASPITMFVVDFYIHNDSDAEATYTVTLSAPTSDDGDDENNGDENDEPAVGTSSNPATMVMGTNTATLTDAETVYYYTYTATESGVLMITMKEDESPNGWAYDGYVNNDEWFDPNDGDGYSSAAEDSALRSIELQAGDTVTLSVWAPEYASGTVVFSAWFTPGEVSDSDSKDEYVVDSDTLLNIGANNVTLDASAETTIYEFTPDAEGTYKFEVSGDLLVGYWGAGSFFVSDQTENKTNTLEATITSVGQSIMVGVTGEGDCTITVSKVEETVTPQEPTKTEIMYENKVTPENFGLADGLELTYVNVTDGKVETAVLGADGYYHLNSADGPILFVNIGYEAPYAKLLEALGYGQVKITVKNEDGSYTVTDYYDAIMEHYGVADNDGSEEQLYSGICPLTDDLIHIFKALGDDKGWYDPEKPLGFYLFKEEVVDPETEELSYNIIPCDENAWMFACAYVEAPAVDVEIEGIDAEDSSWTQGSKVNVVITLDADIATFAGLYIDGKEVAAENYTVEAGSIIITLKEAYLETLALGDHTVAVVYNDGTVTNANLTIVEEDEESGSEEPDSGKQDSEEPDSEDDKKEEIDKKGDVSSLGGYMVVLMGAALVVVALVAKKRLA